MTRLVARNGRIEKESTVESKEPVPHSLTPDLEAVLAELKRQTELMEKISSVLSRLADILDKVSDVKRQ